MAHPTRWAESISGIGLCMCLTIYICLSVRHHFENDQYLCWRKEKEKVVKKEKNMEVVKEKEYCPREGVSSSGSPIFTLRNSQTGASTPPPKPQTPWPDAPPFPPPPLFTSPLLPPNQTPQYCATPAANWGFCGGCHCWGPVLPIWVAQ